MDYFEKLNARFSQLKTTEFPSKPTNRPENSDIQAARSAARSIYIKKLIVGALLSTDQLMYLFDCRDPETLEKRVQQAVVFNLVINKNALGQYEITSIPSKNPMMERRLTDKQIYSYAKRIKSNLLAKNQATFQLKDIKNILNIEDGTADKIKDLFIRLNIFPHKKLGNKVVFTLI